MSCSSCTQTTATITGFNPASCTSPAGCGTDASCVVYTGPPLACSVISPNTTLDVILQTIDPLLCAATGDYSTYNTFCLAPITTQKQFVESISSFVCTLDSNFLTFIDSTFPQYQTTVTGAISEVNNPEITCAIASVGPSDNIPTILSKYCTALNTLNNLLSLSGVNWNSCYVVSPTPTNIVQGFNTLISQICLLKTSISNVAVLPFFNNTGTCLVGGATNDSLVTTIGLLRTRLCQTGTLDTTSITWGCVTAPSGSQNLQDSIQNIVTLLSTVTRATPMTWSNDFDVTPVDGGNPCLGVHVALATPSTQDRFVAATASDSSPGVLQNKLQQGTNITLDYITTPGKVIISAAGSGGGSTVKADSSDSTADYLINKLSGSSGSLGVGVTPVLDTTVGDHIVQLVANVDPVTLFTALLNAVSTDTGLAQLFCQTIAACPSPCAAPTNVTVTYVSGTTTTTTTTTTSTTTTTTTTA